jgi:hypothetical protein
MTGFFDPVNSVIGGVGATDEVLEPNGPIGTTTGGIDVMTGFFDPVNSVIGGVDATDEDFELMRASTGDVGAIGKGFEPLDVFTGGSFEPLYV